MEKMKRFPTALLTSWWVVLTGFNFMFFLLNDGLGWTLFSGTVTVFCMWRAFDSLKSGHEINSHQEEFEKMMEQSLKIEELNKGKSENDDDMS